MTHAGGMPADLLQNGVEATAVVQGMSVLGSGSGLTVNNTPVVDFDLLISPPGSAPYGARVRQLLPYLLVGSVTPGAPVIVRIDRANPSRVAIDFSQVIPRGGAQAMMKGAPLSGDEIRAKGVAGTAQVEQTFSVGSITAPNGDPVLGVIMNVTYPGRPSFLSKNGQRIPRARFNSVVPGAVFPIKGDPSNPEIVVIDWPLLDTARGDV